MTNSAKVSDSIISQKPVVEEFYEMSIGREVKMKELKKEIKRLKAKI